MVNRVVALGEACAHQVTSGMSASRFHEYCYLLLLHLPFSANPRPSRFVSLYCTPYQVAYWRILYCLFLSATAASLGSCFIESDTKSDGVRYEVRWSPIQSPMESDTKSDGVRYEVRWSPIRSPIESDTSPIENPIESPINSDRVRWESPITQSDNESGPLWGYLDFFLR